MTNRLRRAVNIGAEGSGNAAHAPITLGVAVGAGFAVGAGVAVGDGVAIDSGVLLPLPPQDHNHKPPATIDRTMNSSLFILIRKPGQQTRLCRPDFSSRA